MNDTLISVIVPIYKVEQYLSKCVDSIISQTYVNLEIFLIDDGSPDSCGAICDNYAKKDNRIKVIHKLNGGLSIARNVAIDVATGDYIVCIDSDDYVAEDYIETLYSLVKNYDAQMAVTSSNPFGEGSEPLITSDENLISKVMTPSDALTKMFYQNDFDTSAWGKIYHRSLFGDDIRYPKGWLYEDLPTTFLLMMRCQKITYSNYKSYYYLQRANSIEGSSYSPLKYKSCLNIERTLNDERSKMSKEVQKALDCRLLSFIFHVFLEVPYSEKKTRADLFNRIKKYRKHCLFNSNVRKKVQIAAWLSFGGLWLIDFFANSCNPKNV